MDSRINCRRSLGKRGRPLAFDFHRQNSRNPLRCQAMSVSGFTWTNASRHGNIRLRVAIIQRVESSARRGLTLRSWKSASCFRRNRFSAASERRECAARTASRTRSKTTNDTVRTQCSAARKKINEAKLLATLNPLPAQSLPPTSTLGYVISRFVMLGHHHRSGID
jgi:hypothetical protein